MSFKDSDNDTVFLPPLNSEVIESDTPLPVL